VGRTEQDTFVLAETAGESICHGSCCCCCC